MDAVLIEDELEELHSYCQEVFGRVARFHHRLINRRPVSLKTFVCHHSFEFKTDHYKCSKDIFLCYSNMI